MRATIVVDTDSPAIAEEARRWGAEVPFLRPAALAGDDVSSVDSTLGLLDRLEAAGRRHDVVVLLQPTSPLRSVDDVRSCLERFDPESCASVTTVSALDHPAELLVRMGPDGVIQWRDAEAQWRRRQDAELAYRLTGSVYVTATSVLRAERRFVIPGTTRGVTVDAARSIDVDSRWDLTVADGAAGARATPAVRVGGATIGGGAPCFVIAEAGVNHNGDVGLARRLIDAAADAGADAVKFQTFDPEKLVSRGARKAEYQRERTDRDESQLDMLRRLALPREDFAALAEHASSRSIRFLSTAFDEDSADYLESLGVSAFKVPSGEITNHPFVAHLARKGRPLLISTGMSDLYEVDAALRVVEENGNPPVALFHCVTSYPAPARDCNLEAMATMRRALGVPVGWSDHTTGLTVTLAAVAAGAEIVEKHFTIDRDLPGPDHAASLEPDELRDLVASVRTVEQARGSGIKVPAQSERPNMAAARRSLHAAADLPAGHVIGERDLVALRPGSGVSPARLPALLGRALRAPVRGGEMLREDHLA